MTYQDRLKIHLASYKQHRLCIAEPGVFHYRGHQLHYHHILPVDRAWANLLPESEPAARAFFATHPDKRHRYFHHLNSSQAFAFNLFLPYFIAGQEPARMLLQAFGQTGGLAKWQLEAVPVPEEGSNIDVWWEDSEGLQTFCEVKLSETDFGKAAIDERRNSKLDRMYRPLLAGHVDPSRLESLAFFNAYQFNRNLWHMLRSRASRLVFLLPRSNLALWRQIQHLLEGVIPGTRQRISVVAIEEVTRALCTDVSNSDCLRNHAFNLSEKYLVDN